MGLIATHVHRPPLLRIAVGSGYKGDSPNVLCPRLRARGTGWPSVYRAPPSQKRITRISASKHYGQEKRITASDSDIYRVNGVPARYKDPRGSRVDV